MASLTVDAEREAGSFSVMLDQQLLRNWNFQEDLAWTPENPRLFDVEFTLSVDGEAVDEVTSYFGMRKVSVENGKFLLNNRPYFQKLLLDQGYWRKSLLTTPGDEVAVNKVGDIVILMPKESKWAGFLDSLEIFSDDFMSGGRKQPGGQEREEL